EDARVSFGSENVSVSHYFVLEDRLTSVRVMVLDECDCLQRITSCEAHMVQDGHVKRPGVAHPGQRKASREVEGGRAAAHPIENPVLYLADISVEVLRDRELPRHGLAIQKWEKKITGLPLHVIDPVTLHIQSPRH